jgi:hypothetical protein
MISRRRITFCGIAALAVLSAALGGCVAPTTTYRPPSNCYAGYPQGIAAGLPLSQPFFRLRFQLTASYTFKDPNLAHEVVPDLMVAAMNRVSGYEKYRVADGPDSNANMFVNVFQDNTQDHYGISVRMSGPQQFVAGSNSTVPSVWWFRFTLGANYRTGAKLLDDAGIRAAQFLNNGWTCN